MTCDNCADSRLNMRVLALKLAVDGASISHKIDFEDIAARYFVWLMAHDEELHPAHQKPQRKNVKKELT